MAVLEATNRQLSVNWFEPATSHSKANAYTNESGKLPKNCVALVLLLCAQFLHRQSAFISMIMTGCGGGCARGGLTQGQPLVLWPGGREGWGGVQAGAARSKPPEERRAQRFSGPRGLSPYVVDCLLGGQALEPWRLAGVYRWDERCALRRQAYIAVGVCPQKLLACSTVVPAVLSGGWRGRQASLLMQQGPPAS